MEAEGNEHSNKLLVKVTVWYCRSANKTSPANVCPGGQAPLLSSSSLRRTHWRFSSSRQGPARPGMAPLGSRQACYVPSYPENPTKSSVLMETALECQYLDPDLTSCNTHMDYRLLQHLPATLERDTLKEPGPIRRVVSNQNQPWSSTGVARPHRQFLKVPWLGTMAWGGLAATVRAVSGVGCEGGGCRSLTQSPDGKEPLVSLVAQGGGKEGSGGQGHPSL